MPFCFSDLKSECKRRATKDQGGTSFDIGIGNIINTSMWRVSREARWRTLRRETTFDTVATYIKGSGAVSTTHNSKNVTVTGATLITDGVRIGRFVDLSGSSTIYKISTITGETAFTLDRLCNGTTNTAGTYSILGQGEYVLPIQIGHSAFFFHREYAAPTLLEYDPSQTFYSSGTIETVESIPYKYRMWGMDSTLEQVKATSVITIASSVSADQNIAVTVFGTVSGYPDYEIITTNASNGTTAVAGSKSFSSVERVVKNQTTTGRITVTANSGNTTVSVLPVGNTTTGPYYTRVQIYPLPSSVFPITCLYYKLPYQLINDGDVPEIGEEFSEAIILLSVCKLKGEQNQKEDADFFKLYQDEIASLKRTNVDKLDFYPTLKRPSNGGMYNNIFNPTQVGNSGMYGWGNY